ncbi:hypothetical protein [Ornithinimicrobium avium]|uniref:Uncharacterized protein n=1 Tax=Ornithinimicrobium avium TaxID=2283195 RepID=A0A345NJS0_9MICO|nr:hypothetical protein [Ornithinimicrobium avium]AXH95278.1 hypothetical protein DV701_03215 [Ornithinimicrobium avium]
MDATPAPLAPLRTVVWGILVVALDLNLGTFDVRVDPVGYAWSWPCGSCSCCGGPPASLSPPTGTAAAMIGG